MRLLVSSGWERIYFALTVTGLLVVLNAARQLPAQGAGAKIGFWHGID